MIDLGNLNLGITMQTAQFDAFATQLNAVQAQLARPMTLTVNTQAATTGMDAFGASASRVKTILESLGALAAFAVLVKGVQDLGQAAIGLNANLEQSQVRLTALLGSSSAASQMLTQLESVASKSTFGLAQIQAGAAQLLAYGTNAANVIPILQAVQNATAAAGGNMVANFDEITRVLGELNGGLPLTERQLRQLVNAGLPLAPLADQLGITTAALLDTGKTGEISGQQLVTAFEAVYGAGGKFGDQMQKQTQTLAGSLEVIKTNIGLMLANSFQPLFNVIRDLAVQIGNFTQSAQFSAWAAAVQRDVSAVIDVFRSLFTALAPITSALGNFFGISAAQTPTVDIASTVENYSAAQNAAALATQNAGTALVDYAGNAKAAQASLDALTPALDANKQAMMENANAIAAVQDQYAPQKTDLQGQIDRARALSPDDITNKIALANANAEEARIKLSKPDTTDLDAAIQETQNKIRDVGLGVTDQIDINLANLKQQLLAFTDDPQLQALNQQIDALKAKLAVPLDTQTSTNQLTSIAAQLAAPGANRAGLLAQFGDVSRQRQSAVDQNNQSKTALSQLEAQAATIKATDDAHATTLNNEIHQLDAQKASIDAANKAERDGLTVTLDGLQQQKVDRLADYNAALAANGLEKDRLTYLLDQSAAKKDALALPLEQQLKAVNDAESAALAPLQERGRELQAQSRELEYQKLLLDQQKTAADKLLTANKGGGAAGVQPSLATSPTGGPYGNGTLGSDMLTPPPESPFVKFLNMVSDGLHTLTTSDDWNLIMNGRHADGSPATSAERWQTLGDDIIKGLGTVDDKLQAWIKSQDASGIWGIVIYGKKPDGTNADLKTQLGTVNDAINTWLSTNAPKWLTSWNEVGRLLASAWESGEKAFTWNDIKHVFDEIGGGIDTWLSTNGPKWLTSWTSLRDDLVDVWKGLTQPLTDAFNAAWDAISPFFDKLGQGVNWLATHFKLPTIDPFAPDAIPGHAAGILDSPSGHFAMVGERGPELMFVPQHSTIVPNHMLPGHADGFNLGVLDDAVKAVGGAVKGMGTKLVDTLMSAIGTPDTSGVLPGLGGALVDQAKTGLLNWLRPADVAGQATAGGVGALLPLIGLIKASADKYSEPADIIGAIILHESGGVIGKTEIGGGLGRGLMQVDGGTWPQAYDPRMSGTSLDDAAFQIDTGAMILSRGWVPNDIVQSLRNYSGAGFDGVHGRSFYQELVDMGFISAADSALAGGASLVGGAIGGGASIEGMDGAQLLNIAMGDLAGQFGYCEQYVGDVMQLAGLRYDRAGTALIHAGEQSLSPGLGPAGAIAFFDWGDLGHVAFSMGDGQNIWGTQSGPVGGQVGEYVAGLPSLGYTVNPAAGGAFVTSPTLLLSGEGGDNEGEITSPVGMLRKVVREEGGGVTVNVGSGAITVVAPPGANGRQFGTDFADGFMTQMRERGRVATR